MSNNITLFKQPITSLPLNWTVKEFRNKMAEIENKISSHSLREKGFDGGDEIHKGDGCKAGKLEHTFVDGNYIRQITMEAGFVLTSQIHKVKHPYFVMQGDVSVLTEKEIVRIKAPYWGITEPGTKRLLYVHDETIWITVHSTNSTDLEEIEEEVIAKNFDDFENFKRIKLEEGEKLCPGLL